LKKQYSKKIKQTQVERAEFIEKGRLYQQIDRKRQMKDPLLSSLKLRKRQKQLACNAFSKSFLN
jgi:hypothetical protein